MDKLQLARLALEARERAYAPYSHFKVGAAVLTRNGGIYQGCNVENASYGASICAERAAALRAVYEGEREFRAVAVAGFSDGSAPGEAPYSFPCGVCRQFLREFCSPEEMAVYVVRSLDDIAEYTLEELLPCSFGPESLARQE